RSFAPIPRIPVPQPRSTTFFPAMSPCAYANQRTSAAMLAGVEYCSRSAEGFGWPCTFWRRISSCCFFTARRRGGGPKRLRCHVRGGRPNDRGTLIASALSSRIRGGTEPVLVASEPRCGGSHGLDACRGFRDRVRPAERAPGG